MIDELATKTSSATIRGDRGPQDLRRARAAALHDDKADDFVCVVDHPATMPAQVALHLVRHVVGEEV